MTVETQLTFWQKHGKFIAGVAVFAVSMLFVVQQVNPDTVAAFKVMKAREEMLHCLIVVTADGVPETRKEILECAR